MNLSRFFIIAFLGAGFLWSCEGSSTLGNSLVDDNTEVIIDSSFTVSGSSYRDYSVMSRTTTQLLGRLNAKEFGSISSDFVTQFMPADQFDTVGIAPKDIDSVKLIMTYSPGGFTGDSLVPMGLKVYPLTRQLPSPIYSDFDPDGYFSESDCWTPQPHIYSGYDLLFNSESLKYYHMISLKLPIEFGRNFYSEYLKNPSLFSTPEQFAQFFPGIMVRSTFGQGRITNITDTRIQFHYSKHATISDDKGERDTVYHISASLMGVTPEIITNNIIKYDLSESLSAMVNAGKTLLVAPTGYNAKIRFPGQEIINAYRQNAGELAVINTLTMTIPVEEINNAYGITPPANVLLILESEKDTFFAQNKINDGITSFLSTYDSVNKQYYFSGLREYLGNLMKKETIKEEDVNFLLIPVNLTVESSGSDYYYGTSTTYVTSIQPYVTGPSMCTLDLEKTKIRFTYSKQFINN